MLKKGKKKGEPRKVVARHPLKFNLNLGKLIHDTIESHPTLTQIEVAQRLNIGRMGMWHRLTNPTYGTGYNLIEISLLLKKDFISPMLEVINNAGVYQEVKYDKEVVDELKNQIDHYKGLYERLLRENDLLHDLIDKKKK